MCVSFISANCSISLKQFAFRSRWSPDQRAHKHYNNLKLGAGFRKQVGQVCENKLRVRRPATTTKNNFLTNENLQVTVKNSACSFEKTISSFIDCKINERVFVIVVHNACW
jgi:hypothetical protein